MKKSTQNWLIAGFLVLLLVAGYFIVAKPDVGGVIDLNDILKTNTTEEQTSEPTVAVQDISAKVNADASVAVTFAVVASEGAEVQNVSVYYALNVADPNNATYTAIQAIKNNGTYTATIPASFGDVVYYYIEVNYLANNETKTYKSDVYSLTVKDTYAPTLSSVSIDYNATAQIFEINFNATDNDAIAEYIIYYADLGTNTTIDNTTTFTIVNSTTIPVTLSNITEDNYYAFWFEVKDLSGNTVILFNETAPFVLQANASSTWPVVVSESG
ncbi:hypothetical protein [Thermococcus barophilus]|uniref:Uncharacterized protein n=1 Tax=Thermococcus barophilus TaxID=55802 RepID=A0A0S1XAP6_THEBA|nr:hypothetical protein [Thermococcus barophilus]ALM74841.1 conserved exported hypothetical protein [Thermococcus barophilus]